MSSHAILTIGAMLIAYALATPTSTEIESRFVRQPIKASKATDINPIYDLQVRHFYL